MKSILGLLVCALALPPLVSAADAPQKIKALLDQSPFQSQAGRASPVAGPVESIEFRAVLVERHGIFFSLFEKDRHHSTWLELNKPIDDITVTEYNAATLTLKVSYQGKTVWLPLKGATALGLLLALSSSDAPAAPANADSEYHDQPFRIGHVAEEVEIRETVRLANKPLVNAPTERSPSPAP